MRYSIIIPHYNDILRLNRLLRSIPLCRIDLEVIVVDDCTPNQCLFGAVKKLWPTVQWMSTLSNSGAGVARNLGLDVASGQWILFADSDDEYLPRAFELFDQCLLTEDQVVYFMAEGVQETNNKLSFRLEKLNQVVEIFALTPSKKALLNLQLQHVVPYAKVYSACFIRKLNLRFDPVFHGNDVAFNVLCAIQAERVRACTKYVYRNYRRPNSLTADLSPEVFIQRFLVSLSVAERLSSLGYKNIWPGTYALVISLSFGPRIAFKVWWLVIRSPMKIDILSVFNPKKLRNSLLLYAKNKQEVSNMPIGARSPSA